MDDRFWEKQDDWPIWSNHVLAELKRLHDDQNELKRMLLDIKVEVAMLKVKAGIWGALAGMVPVLIAAFVKLLGA